MHFWMTALTSSLLGLMTFPRGGNGSSVSGKTSVALGPFKLVYDFDEAWRDCSRQWCSISATNRQ
jgi:hypothetical protein